jgi:hypothetical protein
MRQINFEIDILVSKKKVKSFLFMVNFFSVHDVLHVDKELNSLLATEVLKSPTIKHTWKGSTQDDDTVERLANRWNFFIESGKVTILQKRDISEINFLGGKFSITKFNNLPIEKPVLAKSSKWTLQQYFVLKYHMLNDLINKIDGIKELDLQELADEYKVNRGFLINFFYSFINKKLFNLYFDKNIPKLAIIDNSDKIKSMLENLVVEMENNLILEFT